VGPPWLSTSATFVRVSIELVATQRKRSRPIKPPTVPELRRMAKKHVAHEVEGLVSGRPDAVFARRYISEWPKARQRRARGLTAKDMEVLHRFVAHLSTSRERRRLDWEAWIVPLLPKVLAGFRLFLDDLPGARPGRLLYAATKAALNQAVRVAAFELVPFGIRCARSRPASPRHRSPQRQRRLRGGGAQRAARQRGAATRSRRGGVLPVLATRRLHHRRQPGRGRRRVAVVRIQRRGTAGSQ
jgi:NAD(P)-dependent dehydrogenase (short-subunit alcohol dehydrogenase family)